MNPGVYREVIEIQKSSYTEDDIGNQLPVWEPYFRCRAYVNHLSGSEYWEAAQVHAENTVVFMLRFSKKIEMMNTTEYQIVWRNKAYNITFIDNIQNKNETVKIRAVARE